MHNIKEASILFANFCVSSRYIFKQQNSGEQETFHRDIRMPDERGRQRGYSIDTEGCRL